MNNKEELDQFIKENCRDCKENCDGGIVETANFFRCVDKNIQKNKKNY